MLGGTEGLSALESARSGMMRLPERWIVVFEEGLSFGAAGGAAGGGHRRRLPLHPPARAGLGDVDHHPVGGAAAHVLVLDASTNAGSGHPFGKPDCD